MQKTTRVCQFISYSADSHYLVNLGKGLANNNIDLICGTLFETGKDEPKWIKESESINYFCLNAKSKPDFPKAVLSLAKILRREKIDILQTHLYEASFVGLLAAKLARIPLRILTRHHLDQSHLIGKKLPIFIDRWETKNCDKIVVLSNAVKEFLVDKDFVDRKKIQVIYQGFDFERFTATETERQSVRNEFGFQENDFVVGTIGNFFSTKGHRFLVEALKKLENEIPNLKLFFVGDGGHKDILVSQITDLNLTKKVVFSGFRADVPACMGAMDAVVHPSLSEAFCQVLIESMSIGKPLISTDVGGAKEVITNNETGLLIPAENTDAIVESIRKVYKDKDFTKKMALAGQKSVRERFTLDKMINQQVECYKIWLKRS